MERRSASQDVRVSINPARGATRARDWGCVWSVSFKGGTAGRAITADLPLAAGPGATLTESNHKQVNSTSTFLIFFPPVSFFWTRSVYLDEELLFPLPPPPPLSAPFQRGALRKWIFNLSHHLLLLFCFWVLTTKFVLIYMPILLEDKILKAIIFQRKSLLLWVERASCCILGYFSCCHSLLPACGELWAEYLLEARWHLENTLLNMTEGGGCASFGWCVFQMRSDLHTKHWEKKKSVITYVTHCSTGQKESREHSL